MSGFAAARTRLLTPGAILERLRDRFRLLRGGEADRPARHRSLEASIQGSWELLSPAEKCALCQLATLRAPASLATAEAILDVFLDTPFGGARHQRRIDKIEQ